MAAQDSDDNDTTLSDQRTKYAKSRRRDLVLLVFALHVGLSILAWRSLPGGFPVTHARFWTNRFIPASVAVAATIGLVAALRYRVRLAQCAVFAFSSMHLGAGVAAFLSFPSSGRLPAIAAVVAAAALATLPHRSHTKNRSLLSTFVSCAVGLLFGATWTTLQRADDPATRPFAKPTPLFEDSEVVASPAGMTPDLDLPAFAAFNPHSAFLSVHVENVIVGVDPRLQFTSRSPDRCWTILSTQRPNAFLRELRSWKQTDKITSFFYSGKEPAIIAVGPHTANAVAIEARTLLPEPVFSHLNTYALIDIRGHKRLSLGFSPCDDELVEVTYSEYPVGRPARFAYIDADRNFRVVEAQSAEKGPFRELAQGRLPRRGPLAITVHDSGRPLVRVSFEDFAAQASTQPSPTAGWGVAENAIEFSLSDNRPDASATIWISLAATSVGRGWDSVGHAAGVYLSRVTIERLSQNE